MLLSPIMIEPLFNEYKPVPAGPVRDALLKMADEADIPQDRLPLIIDPVHWILGHRRGFDGTLNRLHCSAASATTR